MKNGFFVLTGVNGIGKTHHIKILKTRLSSRFKNITIKTLKFHIYDSPSGQIINSYIRNENKDYNLNTTEFQLLCYINKLEYQNILIDDFKNVKENFIYLVEDYDYTSFIYAKNTNSNIKLISDLNKNLIKPDLYLVLHGNSFLNEKNHKFESDSVFMKTINESYKNYSDFKKHIDNEHLNFELINANNNFEVVNDELYDMIICYLNKLYFLN